MFSKKTSERSPLDVRALVGEVIALVQGELETDRVLLRREITDPSGSYRRSRSTTADYSQSYNERHRRDEFRNRTRQAPSIASGIDENGMVRITVEDTGSGIEPVHLNRIFEPFFTTKSTGMGLGLCICRSIVETHGGKLWASPRNPFGTQFHLTLPRAEEKD
jgi:hypothetical protein